MLAHQFSWVTRSAAVALAVRRVAQRRLASAAVHADGGAVTAAHLRTHHRCHGFRCAAMTSLAQPQRPTTTRPSCFRGYNGANHIIWGVCNALPSVGAIAAGAGQTAALLSRRLLPIAEQPRTRSISTLRKRKKKPVASPHTAPATRRLVFGL